MRSKRILGRGNSERRLPICDKGIIVTTCAVLRYKMTGMANGRRTSFRAAPRGWSSSLPLPTLEKRQPEATACFARRSRVLDFRASAFGKRKSVYKIKIRHTWATALNLISRYGLPTFTGFDCRELFRHQPPKETRSCSTESRRAVR